MSALTNNLQRRLFDAHCHLQFHVERTKKLLEADALSSSSIQGGIGLASTRQEDWSSVAELAAANVFVKPCFGLHPWWVELESSNADILACLMNDLRDRLETNSAAIVGEIGLDRIHCDYKYRDTPRSDSPGPGPFESSTTPDFESGETRDSIKLDAKALQAQLYSSQKELLQAQWNLAGELNRPVVLHCVKAQGDMQAFIRREAQKEERAVKAAKKIANLGEEKDTMQAISLTSSPPRIYLHAFGGSAETVRQYLAIKPLGARIYFGFAAAINLRASKTREVIRAVPSDRLLLESDLEDPSGVNDSLATMLQIYSDVKGWTLDEAAAITARNARRFYGSQIEDTV